MNLLNNPDAEHFPPVLQLIQHAKARALSTVNQQLLELYWQIGEYLSLKVAEQGWGKHVMQQLADWLATQEPNLRGFSAQNLWRMKQFFETYQGNEKLSPLVRVLSWTHNLLILSKCKTEEERGFYLNRDHDVVEYALSRSLSPTVIAQYQTRLPDKALLQAKLDEFYELAKMEIEQ